MTDSLYIRWREDGTDDDRTDPGPADRTWLSKSLKVLNPKDRNQDEGLALVGVEQQIRVLVDTTRPTTEVGVQAWVRAFGPAGAPFLPSANGAAGLERTGFTVYPAPPAAQLAVDIAWTPQPEDLELLGSPAGTGLHVCLLGNCYATGSQRDGGRIRPPGPPLLDIATNRHHAQRNIRLHPVPAGGVRAHVPMLAGNPFADGAEVFLLGALEVRLPVVDGRTIQRLQAGRWLRDDRGLAGLGGTLRLARRRLSDVRLRIAGEDGRKGVHVPLAVGEPQRLELDVAVPDADPGALHVVDVVQRSRRSRRPVGGARVLLLVVDEARYRALLPGRLSGVT